MRTVYTALVVFILGFLFGLRTGCNQIKPCNSETITKWKVTVVHDSVRFDNPVPVKTYSAKSIHNNFDNKPNSVSPVITNVSAVSDDSIREYQNCTEDMSVCVESKVQGKLLQLDIHRQWLDSVLVCPPQITPKRLSFAPYVFANGYHVPCLGIGGMVISRKNIYGVQYDVLNGNYGAVFGVRF